jgi:hypothetical protein
MRHEVVRVVIYDRLEPLEALLGQNWPALAFLQKSSMKLRDFNKSFYKKQDTSGGGELRESLHEEREEVVLWHIERF